MVIISHLVRISPAILRQATYGTIKIGVYQTLKSMAVENPQGIYFFFLILSIQLSNLSHPIPLFPPTHITCTLTCHWLWQFLCSIGQEFYLYINLVNTFHFKSELQGPKKLELKVLVLIYVCIDSWLIPEDRTDQQHVMSEPVIIVAEIKLHCIKLHSNYLMFMLGFPLH